MESNANSHPASQSEQVVSMPEFLRRALTDGGVRELDVRPMLESGNEPFMAIMQVVEDLKPGEVFKLVAPFEPAPLFAVLGRKGYAHWSQAPEAAGERAWRIFFFRENLPDATPVETAGPADEDFAGGEGDEAFIDLDVRGMEPPQPLEIVLETAEQMAYGDVLRVRHHRNPLILFDVLAERGFGYRSEEVAGGEWAIRIWRKS